MNYKFKEYICNIIKYHDINEASNILENYIINIVKDFINKKGVEESLVELLGTLGFLYSKKNIDKNRIEIFIHKLSNIFPYGNIKLIKHISNFMEIVLLYNPEVNKCYLYELNKFANVMEEDHSAILYKAFAVPCYKNYIDYNKIEHKIKYPWRYYYDMANLYGAFRDYLKAFKYIRKALKCCPTFLKEEYTNKYKYIYKQMKNNRELVDGKLFLY
ncbi:hypothetical protein ACFIJ5_16750 [Haloimpatiens sp. FM7330]|uniref:hypothetical protein n=1 Tax=Haloimpatiens sp. FM7330 TaxID=3298610 RepID=UPI00362A9EFF